MRQVTRIEMANDNELYEVSTRGQLTVNKLADDDFEILLNGEVIDEACSQQEADDTILEYVVDEYMVVSGYGKHSGCKFWQLPESIQNEVMKIAAS